MFWVVHYESLLLKFTTPRESETDKTQKTNQKEIFLKYAKRIIDEHNGLQGGF